MKFRVALAVAAISLALLVAQACGLFGGGSPSIWSPAPFLFVIPAFMGVPVLLVLFLFVAIFCVWSPALFRGESSSPRRTTVLYVAFGVLSAASYISGWNYGAQYEGLKYTVTCAVLSALLFSVYNPENGNSLPACRPPGLKLTEAPGIDFDPPDGRFFMRMSFAVASLVGEFDRITRLPRSALSQVPDPVGQSESGTGRALFRMKKGNRHFAALTLSVTGE